jgi:malic enzyme
LKVVGKDVNKVKLVTSGAGAAALACLGLLVKLGIPRENIWVTDLAGLVYEGRTELMDEDKIQFSQKTAQRTLAEAIEGADVFLGLSAGGVLKPDMVKKMAGKPFVLLGVSNDSVGSLRALEGEELVTWRNFCDVNNSLATQYRILGRPLIFVLDKERKIQYVGNPGTFAELTADALILDHP